MSAVTVSSIQGTGSRHTSRATNCAAPAKTEPLISPASKGDNPLPAGKRSPQQANWRCRNEHGQNFESPLPELPHGRVHAQALLRRNLPGVMPSRDLNTRVRWL